MNILPIIASEVQFATVARTRWTYFGRFVNASNGAVIMSMAPLHQVRNNVPPCVVASRAAHTVAFAMDLAAGYVK